MQFSTIDQVQADDLLRAHETRLRGYLLAIVRNPHDMDDLYQEVCLAVIKDFRRLDDPARFLAWAIGIARNRIRSHFARTGRDERLFAHLDMLTDTACRTATMGDEGSLVQQDLLDALRRCMRKLHARDQTLIELRYDDEPKGWHEIALKFNSTENSLTATLSRIRRKLHSCIQSQLHRE